MDNATVQLITENITALTDAINHETMLANWAILLALVGIFITIALRTLDWNANGEKKNLIWFGFSITTIMFVAVILWTLLMIRDPILESIGSIVLLIIEIIVIVLLLKQKIHIRRTSRQWQDDEIMRELLSNGIVFNNSFLTRQNPNDMTMNH